MNRCNFHANTSASIILTACCRRSGPSFDATKSPSFSLVAMIVQTVLEARVFLSPPEALLCSSGLLRLAEGYMVTKSHSSESANENFCQSVHLKTLSFASFFAMLQYSAPAANDHPFVASLGLDTH
jgi:hypothetical protein